MCTEDYIPHPRLKFVNHGETYGRHILDQFVQTIRPTNVLDLGCGQGADLGIVRRHHESASLHGVDYQLQNQAVLEHKGIRPVECDIERQVLPFDNESIDLVIANQVLEHTKEIFWINHEIFRVLNVGGWLYLGVPNALSLHSRLLGLIGVHPTSCQMLSAHVRPFSKRDTYKFYQNKASGVCSVEQFFGAQFYPFPVSLARPLANWFPSMAVSIFFAIRKTSSYGGEFVQGVRGGFETNYFVGAE